MTASGARRRRGVLGATVFTLAGIAILVGLGVWQLDRKAWKEGLIARISARFDAPPASLPPRAQWDRLSQDASEFVRVVFPAEFFSDQEALVYSAGSALRPDISGPGYWVFSPARLPGGSIVVVNRGFVPENRKDPASRAQGAFAGPVDVTGVLRWPEARGMFTPADDPKGNVWYLRDHRSMASAKNWGPVGPFYIDQEAPQPAGGLPSAGRLTLSLPDNHLHYALTWFGLALALAGVYVTWLVSRRRR